ncbi:hypothetical protein HGI81_01145 [Olsenella sp. KGMB02461]|nr:hypothetical protein [Olsenella sp. KGMB02461]
MLVPKAPLAAPLEVERPQNLEKFLIEQPEEEPSSAVTDYEILQKRAGEISQWLSEQRALVQRQLAASEPRISEDSSIREAGSSRPELEFQSVGDTLKSVSASFYSQQAAQEEALKEAVRKAVASERRAAKEREDRAVDEARAEVRQELLERTRTAEAQYREAQQALQRAKASVAAMTEELEQLRGAGDQLEQERAAREAQERAHAIQISALENEARRLRASLVQVGQEDEVDVTPVAEPLDVIRTLPTNLEECVRLFAGLQDRVEFLESAYASARNYRGGDLDRYWRSLLSLHDVLWPLRATNREYGVDVAREFRNKSGFEYAANESQETLAIEECRRARTFRYQGKDQLMVNHVKVGNSGNIQEGAMRIYLLYDADRKKIIVGHIGKHLPTKTVPGSLGRK